MTKAARGRQLLIEKADKYRLILINDTECDNEIDMVLSERQEDGTTEILDNFDMSSIFEQVVDMIEANEREVYLFYWNGQEKPAFGGTPQDVARWYCGQEGIKLYTDTTTDPIVHKGLFATFPDRPNERSYIAAFVDMPDDDIETAYKLFCTSYLMYGGEMGDFRVEKN